MDTSTGRADMNVVDGDSVFGAGIGTIVVLALQIRLFVISFDRSVIISIIKHHSGRLNEPLKVSRRYISMHIVVEHIRLTADSVFMCMCLYAASRSNLQIKIGVIGFSCHIELAILHSLGEMNQYIMGSKSSTMT